MVMVTFGAFAPNQQSVRSAGSLKDWQCNLSKSLQFTRRWRVNYAVILTNEDSRNDFT
jgi:hypothetical protein